MKKSIGMFILLVGAFLLGYFSHTPEHGITFEELSNLEKVQPKEINKDTCISFREVSASYFSATKDKNATFQTECVIPNAAVASQVAVAISKAIYGDDILQQMPMKVCLVDGIWKIEGTVHSQKGGSVYMEIDKKDGKVRYICHSK